MKSKYLLATALVLIGIVFLSGCAAPADDGINSAPTGAGTVNQDSNEATQTKQETDGPQIIVEYTANTKGVLGSDEYLRDEAESGMTYLILDMTVTNKGYEEFSTNPFYWQVIVDNVKYDTAFVVYLDDELGTKTLLNDGKASGKLAFEVPADVSNFEIVYDSWQTYNIAYIQK